MTTYIDGKAVGVGTIRAEIGVTGVVLHDNTLVGNGNTEPLGVNTANIVSQQTLANTISVLNTAIDAQAEAIAKTRNDFEVADQNVRADMNAKDSELETILNDHAERLATLRTDHDDLGDDVSDIQAKIPQSASGSNPLITKQQLLDEEMDIREDLNEIQNELQTQLNAQATAIAGKQDQLTAGDNVVIDSNGVISATVPDVGGFDMVVVDQLPETGEKGILYLVKKDGAAPDVHDEYVWIESTQTFELIGTTQVDLTDYVKNTDYATSSTGGVVKCSSGYGLSLDFSTGQLSGSVKNLVQYNIASQQMLIAKGTLENIKDDYIKRGLTENAIELTDEEKITACNWLGTNKTASLTQAEYDALTTKDTNTLYLIEEE